MTVKATKPMSKSFLDTITEPLKDVGKTLEEARERSLERNREISVKVIEIAETNTREAFGAARAAAGAKSVVELVEIQNAFLREQATRGTTQLRELGELLYKANQDAWSPITSKFTSVLARA